MAFWNKRANGFSGRISYVVAKKPTEPAPPVSVIESLTTGFETAAARAGLMLLPLLLDLFLWLGPHISIRPLTSKLSEVLEQEVLATEAAGDSRFQLLDTLRRLGDSVNVFAFVSTAPLGIPSLIAGKSPTVTPIGAAQTWMVHGELELITLVLGFSLIGLLLGAVYFGLIARQLTPTDQRSDLAELLSRIWIDWARIVAFVTIILVVFGILTVPLLLMVGLAGLLNTTLANVVMSVGVAAGLWLLLYVGFVVHGIVLQKRGLLAAIWESVRLVQWNLPGVIGLFTLVMIISWGLGFLWNIPAADNWLLLASIGGHAYIATGLATATFVFYQDRSRWWNELRAYRHQRRAAEQARKRTS